MKTKVVNKFIPCHFVPVIYSKQGNKLASRELGPRPSEAESWQAISEALTNEPVGSFGEVEQVEAKHILMVEEDNGLIIPDKPKLVLAGDKQ